MRPLRLKVSNLLSYRGEHEIDLDGVALAVLSGPNGAGKSTLIDAMRFALFGHSRRPRDLDSMISDGEDVCRVEFSFALDSQTYLVSRTRSRRGRGSTLLSFQVLQAGSYDEANDEHRGRWQGLDGKTVDETQARIISTLHMTDDLFIQTACANQGNAAAFSEAAPGKRKEILGEGILDLGQWERRAEIARQMGRDLAATLEADQKRHEGLQAAASGADGLREQIAQTEATQADVTRQVGQAEGDLGQGQEAKEALLRDREADRARRKELEDLAGRAKPIQTAIDDATTRLSQLEKTVSGKAAVLDGIRRAEEAQTYSQELEAKRQEDERLRHEAELVRQRQQSAVAEHARKIEALKERVKHLRSAHEHEIDALLAQIEVLSKQAEVLGEVPCANPHDEATRPSFLAIRDKCPLIAQAREAQVALPGLEERLQQLQSQQPWAEEERRLHEVEAQRAGDQEAARLREIAEQRSGVGYDPKEHADAKRRAGRLQELQQELRRVERAEAQMHELLGTLESRTTEAKEIAGRIAALESELGPARNWDAMLAQVDRSISAAKQQLRDLQAQGQSLQAQHGALKERLRAAEEAAEQAKQVATSLADGERRLKLLKILAQAFGKQGIPALLIEKAIPDLEAVANDVLSTLTDGRMSLQLRSQRETKAKTIQETLDVVIADERGDRAYENFSGGEAMRVDLALRIALSVLLASRAGARCELLVLDETAAPLDAHGRALFVDCLQRVAERFATILVITHVEELKDLFPFRFEISKTATGSEIRPVAV
jgi:exonuclease SbcC